ncbi:hypothetical protein [Mucilaginibacter myungsuensis]|uniref:Uncharacterized protein n=1 Tax=Mucilaginibacter myungsuensis TaxID=649104 RepID=A0A929PYS8_9SPHI|nr:hypothetical protein [Mucilaginibacter myungsuensis]MBE9663770.1 hypothetical protein [Mucilaginibacter myungsuensis]MDN3598904.1 hypothetical protein [Mucilaginibacter myungsuensis]
MTTLHKIYISYIVPGSTLLPIGAAVAYYRQIARPLHTLLAYLCIAFVINVMGTVMASYGKNNLPLLHFYTAFELVAVLLYYKHAFADRKLDKVFNTLMVGFPLLCVVNFTFFQSIYTFNTYTRPLEALMIIMASGLYLLRADGSKESVPGRWVASGFLLYFCSALFQFIFSNALHHYASKAVRSALWDVHATLVMIMYIIFFIAIRHARLKR